MRKKKKESISWKRILQNNVYSLCFMYKNAKLYMLVNFINIIIYGLHTPTNIILTAKLFNMLDEGTDFRSAAFVLGSLAGVSTIRIFWEYLEGSFITPQLQQKLHLKIQMLLFEKAKKIEFYKYDNPDYYNEYILVMQYADSYAMGAIGNITSFIRVLFTFMATLGVLLYVDLIAMIIILGSAILSMLISSKIKKIEYNMVLDYTPINKKAQYIDRIHKLPDYAKELRLTDLEDKLIEDYDNNNNEYIKLAKTYGWRKVWYNMLEAFNKNCIYMSVIAWTIYRIAVTGTVMLGGFTVVVQANMQFRETLLQFANLISSLPQQSMFIDKVRYFMEYTPEDRHGMLPASDLERIELRNVFFGYNENAPVLKNVNMTVRRGEKIAIVGYNGAGKTTFVKLLMHLYQPDSGQILYNGIDIKEIEMDSYRDRIGAVFQDYKIFAATIAENVLGDEFKEGEYKTVMDALESATFDNKLDTLGEGINTILTREFDDNGTNLSGGEAQKIAIARVFAKPYDLIIMDEPSSALDPIAEYELNCHIGEYAEDKTVIFISHRLSTTRHVDRIYMFEDGQVIESGSHDELIELGGKYAEMFHVQAEKYLKN